MGTGREDTTANVPAGTPAGTGTEQSPERRTAPALAAGHESGAGTGSTEAPASLPAKGTESTTRPPVKSAEGLSHRPAQAPAEPSAPRSTAAHGEDPGTLARSSSSHPQDQQVAKPSRAVETVPAAAEGGEQRSAGYRGQPATVTTFGSAEYFVNYLWDAGSSPVQQVQDELASMRDGARNFAAGTPHGGTLTQRGPPLQIPSPFSGFGIVMGGAAFGASSSGTGGDPLLAVLFCCLSVLLWRGRSRAYGALLRAGTVPRLPLERPG